MLASRSAYFSAWRRCTRPETAVAVLAEQGAAPVGGLLADRYDRRKVFEAGFQRAWNAALSYRYPDGRLVPSEPFRQP